MSRWIILLIVSLVAVTAAGCGGGTSVVLTPESDGHVGKVVVENKAGSQVLDEAYQRTSASKPTSAPKKPVKADPDKIKKEFKDALAAQPSPPEVFKFYFKSESSELQPQYFPLLTKVAETVKKRNSVDTDVAGHTDTSGDKKYNFVLAERRARIIEKLLVERGVDPLVITVYSFGEDDPLIKTGDNVFEPRNRRVEVTVR